MTQKSGMSDASIRTLILVVLFTVSACGVDSSDRTSERLVAIGDLHGDIGSTRQAFKLAGAIDESDRWIDDNLTVVQLGDAIGRSYQDREVLDFLLALQQDAAAAGGRLHLLIGNHEVFGARLELRWVHDDAYESFASIPDLNLDDPGLADLPAYQRPRGAALLPGGYYARKLSEFPAVLRIGDTVFAHGGVTPHWANYGVDQINVDVHKWFKGETAEPLSTLGMDPGNFDDSVMQSRHFSIENANCEMLGESLKILGAKRMVVAHTVQRTITSKCDGLVWAIDTGMSRYYGGAIEVLEIIDDSVVSVVKTASTTLDP
jgi:hypothetical protein